MAYLRVSVNHLRKGMTIVGDIYANTGVVLVAAGTPVTKDVISLLARHFIDSVMVEYHPTAEMIATVSDDTNMDTRRFQEFHMSFQLAEETLSQNLLDVVERSKDIEVEFLLDTMNGIIEKADSDTNLTEFLFRMKKASTGLFAHAMNVALFGQILASWLQCSKEETELITIAGLLHDIGHLKKRVGAREGFLLSEEVENGDNGRHAIDGYNILKNQKIDERVKQAVLTHHERLDGSGCPLQVTGADINRISRIIAIADTYDVLTSQENGQETLSAFTALWRIEESNYGKLDSHCLMRFMSNIAETMIQHQVRLSDGRQGKIIMINKYDISRPLVQVGDSFIDLSSKKELMIKEILD